MGVKKPDPKRFWSKVEKTASGCWLWHGYKNRFGYGRLRFATEWVMAHRLSLRFVGVEVPTGMVVDHICRVRNCVNPEHLRVVTKRQNTIENSLSVPAVKAAMETCKLGHPLVQIKRNRYCRVCNAQASRDRRARLRAQNS